MRELARVFRALGDETRLRILAELKHRQMCVCELAAALEVPQPTLSHHLGILRDVGLVKGERDGTWTYCSLEKQRFNECGLDFLHLLERKPEFS
ncbi:MAG: winged helix-turn-helix transcriptional regulator [Firmicutes bacterium]|nr:winged helix-turn-helix transcriptional regulator [Bacillota bacterium]